MFNKTPLTIFLLLALFFLIVRSNGYCQEDRLVASFTFNQEPEEDMTFIKLRRTLSNKSGSAEEVQRARFTIAEYYFKHNDVLDAFRAFKEFTGLYPPSVSTLLAKTYLYKIAKLKKNEEVAESLKKEMFDKTFILLFTKFKQLTYRSALNNQYEVHYYLDKIKIFLNGGIFEEITP